MKTPSMIKKNWFIIIIIAIIILLEFIEPKAIWLKLIFAKPSSVIISLAQKIFLGESSAWHDIIITMKRVFLGLLIGSVVGIPIGLLTGTIGKNVRGIKQFADFFRSIPQIALFPLLAIAFGIGDFGKIMMTAISVFFIMFVGSLEGALYGVRERKKLLEMLGANNIQQFRYLTIPQSLPSIVTGLRISSSIAVIVVIVTEMLYGTLDGLGYKLYLAQLSYSTVDMWAYIIILGMIGILINKVVVQISKRVIFWDRMN